MFERCSAAVGAFDPEYSAGAALRENRGYADGVRKRWKLNVSVEPSVTVSGLAADLGRPSVNLLRRHCPIIAGRLQIW